MGTEASLPEPSTPEPESTGAELEPVPLGVEPSREPEDGEAPSMLESVPVRLESVPFAGVMGRSFS